MCGFAGVISWSERHRTSRAMLARMSAAIAHRGPDGEGIYFDRDPEDLSQPISSDRPQVALAFRRLAVLDPTPCSDQPFVSSDGRYVMVFNGEIYNFRNLKSEITDLKPDYAWRTAGDTEVLLMAYSLWAERCVDRLNGMFAFAVWDHQERSLFLARDRMGQKPLYVATVAGEALTFSSEPAGLRPTVSLAPLNLKAIHAYLSRGALGTLRMRHRRYAFRAAHTGRCTQPGARPTPRPYYLPAAAESYEAFVMATYRGTGLQPVAAQPQSGHGLKTHATIRSAVQRAVVRQLVSDVPLGVFLSGGIDSSVITLCARKDVEKLKTFSIAFDDPRYDESPYAREVAKHLGTDHHEFRVTPNVIEDLPKLARVFGEPFADSSAIPTHYLARETRKHVTVALSGDGGDELFGGYGRYVAMQAASRVPRAIDVLLAPIGRLLSRGHPKSNLARAGRFFATLGLPPADRYDALVRIFDDATIADMIGAQPKRYPGVKETFDAQLRRTGNVVTAALATDRVTYLPDDLLTKVDRCSMLHGLEVRSPFMDHELVELAAQLTEDQLLKGGKKRMLREAFASELPASVFSRPKMGFAVPIGEWFRGPLRPFLRDHLFASDSFARKHFQMPVVERLVEEHERQRRDHSQRLYALLMLELWWKQMIQDG